MGLIPLPDSWKWRTGRYVTAVMLALLLTTLVLYYLSAGLVRVQDTVTVLPDGGTIQLGFATIFKGRYVDGVPPDWIFSLTSAPPTGQADTTTAGFCAPLWALLLSVVGAALFTISLIVGGILESFRAITADQVRERVRLIVLHELYVVFAPVGAILVYQAMVAAGIANEPATVGLVLLASGVDLNLILNTALEKFSDIMGIKSGRASNASEEGASSRARTPPSSSPCAAIATTGS